MSTLTKYRRLLEEIVNHFGDALEHDDPINGGDAVEWIVEFCGRVEEELRR